MAEIQNSCHQREKLFSVMTFMLLVQCGSLPFIACARDDEADYRQMAFEKKVVFLLFLPANAKGVTQMTTKVQSEMKCAFACVRETWCYSANFKTIPEGKGLHICELISTDEITHGKYLKQDQEFVHLKIKNVENPCEKSPCTEKEDCIRSDDSQGYLCQCKEGHHGKKCEKCKTCSTPG